MKTILVLTDFSLRSELAAEYAADVAKTLRANILLSHAIEITNPVTMEVPVAITQAEFDALKTQSMYDLSALSKRLESRFSESGSFRPVIDVVTDFGSPDQVAQQLIEDRDVILVAAAAHHNTLLSRFLSGSTTHTLLDTLDCPVLLVPEECRFQGWNHLAYATDHTFDNLGVIRWLADLAEPFRARIRVMHVIKPGFYDDTDYQNHVESLKQIASRVHGALYYKEFRAGDALHRTLLKTCKVEKSDLLAVVHKHYAFPESVFHTSISMKLADAAELPLLVFPGSFCEAEAV